MFIKDTLAESDISFQYGATNSNSPALILRISSRLLVSL